MTEIELKFAVPTDRPRRVADDAHRGTRSLPLKAVYFDTDDRRLAGAGVSLRLRQEGDRWVQTAKAPGTGPVDRQEHNAPRTAASVRRDKFKPDISLHDGTPAGDAVRDALGKGELQEVFRTEVVRLRCTEHVSGAQIELAFDEGAIIAGAHQQPIHEIEFELKAGPPAGLFTLARHWVEQHGLWLEGRSKAERGDFLSRGEVRAPPRKAGSGEHRVIQRASGEVELLRALVNASLRQVIANASEVASGGETADHAHQLRVGLRRLRTALRAFGDAVPPLQEFEAPIAEVFRKLGAWRDSGVTRDSIVPRLRDAGAPSTDLPVIKDERVSPTELVRQTSFQLALLAMMEFGMEVPSAADPGGDVCEKEALDADIEKRLSKLHKQVRQGGRRFERLPQDEQHRVRKRLKRLRYLAEFVAPRYKHRAVRRYLAALEPAQDALGAHNDTVVAVQGFRAAVEANPSAWFAVGYLTARLEESAACGGKALKAIKDKKRFWR